jgi:hypothetical protein
VVREDERAATPIAPSPSAPLPATDAPAPGAPAAATPQPPTLRAWLSMGRDLGRSTVRRYVEKAKSWGGRDGD